MTKRRKPAAPTVSELIGELVSVIEGEEPTDEIPLTVEFLAELQITISDVCEEYRRNIPRLRLKEK